jgi:hypothetical protein
VLSTGSDAVNAMLEHIDYCFAIKSNFNINQKGIRNYVTLFKVINETIPTISIGQLCEWFANVFVGGVLAEKSALPTDTKQLISEKMQALCEGETEVKGVLGQLTYAAFKYYANIDQFHGIMLYRTNNESTKHTAIFVPESANYYNYTKHIESVSGPSLVDARTSKSFKIRMRA